MQDGCQPEAAIYLNGDDSVLHLGRFEGAGSLMRGECEVFVAVHRKAGVFTHLYLVPSRAVRARREVRLAAVFAGEAVGPARQWAAQKLRPVLSAAFEDRLAA